jgi:O-succinylbenzoic acid--CoA ligase
LPVDAEGWLETDDLGRLDPQGNLHVLGRRSDVVITGGENVYPAEVEAALERCPGVAAACVFGIPDPTWGELVATAVVISGDQRPSLVALAQFAREELAPHRRPRRIAFVAELATTPAGKLDRKETARRARAVLEPLE